MIALGLLLFAARLPAKGDTFVNLPLILTVIQTAGLMFFIAGVNIILSRLVWPTLSFGELVVEVVHSRSAAAAQTLGGLLIYNGLSTLAFVWWLTSAFGAGLAAGS